MSSGGAEDALRFAGRTSSDPADAVSRWKATTGGKAAGCLPLYIPEEILHASGMLPVTVCGDEYRVVPEPCPWEIIDGWVLPPVSGLPPESVNFLPEAFTVLPQVSLGFPSRGMKVPSGEEALDRVEMLREWAGDVSGMPANDGALSKSISVYNESRRLFSALEGRLASTPGAYSAVEVYRLFRSAMALPREAHTGLLRAALSRGPADVRRFRARIFLGGMTALRPVMEAIDASGAALAGEAFDAGHRTLEAMVDEAGDPALALARRLRSRMLGLAEEEVDPSWAARLLDRVEASGAERFLHLGTGSDAHMEKIGKLAEEAGKRGIPFLCLEMDLSPGWPEQRKERIASFLRKDRS